jgi:hypothetical protein
MDAEMTEINCALFCCFRMFRHPDSPDFLSDSFLGDDSEMDCYYDFAVCTATKEGYEKEIAPSPSDDDDDDPEYMGGVPGDCPIFQGLAAAPWIVSDNEQSA